VYNILARGSIVLLRHCKRTVAGDTLRSTATYKVDPATVSSPYPVINQMFADQAFCPEYLLVVRVNKVVKQFTLLLRKI
jgi:hypothetical protein